MTQKYMSIEDFNETLKEWIGKTIEISKHELEDDDNTILALTSITYSKDTRRLDEYEPMHTLQLNGSGEIKTDEKSPQSLPSSLYEIPIEDSTIYKFEDSKFTLITDRGTYTIKLASEE